LILSNFLEFYEINFDRFYHEVKVIKDGLFSTLHKENEDIELNNNKEKTENSLKENEKEKDSKKTVKAINDKYSFKNNSNNEENNDSKHKVK